MDETHILYLRRHGLHEIADYIERLQGDVAEMREIFNTETSVLRASRDMWKERAEAADRSLKVLADAVRERHHDDTPCGLCEYDTPPAGECEQLNECPGFERDDCFKWRGQWEADALNSRRIEELERERDAVIEVARGRCHFCKFFEQIRGAFIDGHPVCNHPERIGLRPEWTGCPLWELRVLNEK